MVGWIFEDDGEPRRFGTKAGNVGVMISHTMGVGRAAVAAKYQRILFPGSGVGGARVPRLSEGALGGGATDGQRVARARIPHMSHPWAYGEVLRY